MKTNTFIIVTFLCLFFLGCDQQKSKTGIFKPSPSPIEVPPAFLENGKFMYGYMEVPEFHSKPKGKTLELALAVHKCLSDSATHEPLILITGGPGMSDIDAFVPMLFGDMGNLFLNNRDIVIIELRGLKYSRPNLITPEITRLQMDILDKNLTVDETIDVYIDTMKVVYDRFVSEGVNLSAFNDYEIASDIVFVMQHLGYDKFSVFGSSFGTLVCEHLILNHSEHLVSVVMNAVVDINKGFNQMHTNSIATLETILETCENDPELKAAYPDLKNRFLTTIRQLNEQPVMLQLKNPADGQTYDYLLNGSKLSVWLFAMMYYNPQLPLTLHKITTGDYSELISSPGILFPMEEFSNGLSYSIILSENTKAEPDQLHLEGEYADFVKGSGELMFTPYFLNRAREVWKVEDVSQENILIQSDVPTLIFSGELDHVCPPADAKKLAEQLTNAYLYVFPGIAHSPIDAGMCGIMMMKEFIDNPSKAPNSECIQEFKSGFVVSE